jgi:membrane protease YdiL (CAAX protease family)
MSRIARLLWVVWLLVGVSIATLLLSAGSDAREGDALLELSADVLLLELWLVTLALAIATGVARDPRDALGLAPGGLSWSRIAGLALGTLAASHALDGALDLSGLSDHSVLGRIPQLLADARGERLAFALLALGLAPGIAEELLCRGLIQRGLLGRLGPALAIPMAALLFGLLHREPIHAAFATVLGLYLGLVAFWAGSTRPAMLCHAANNLAAVLLGAGIGATPWASGVSVVGGASLAGLCLWVARPRPGAPSPDSGTSLQPRARPSDR